MLAEEIAKMSNMHDNKHPIPGIIYKRDQEKLKKFISTTSARFCRVVKDQNLSRQELAFLISSIVNQLGITQEDFMNLKNALEKGDEIGDDKDDDSEDKDEDEDEEEDEEEDHPRKF